MPKKPPTRTFTVTREEFDNDDVIVSDVVIGVLMDASAKPGKRAVPLSAVGELSQECLLDLNTILGCCECEDWAIAALMRVLQFVAQGEDKVDVEDRANWACHYIYQQGLDADNAMQAFLAKHDKQKATGRPVALPAAQLNLDTLSIKHLRCEKFWLEDKDTGQVRMEINTHDGAVSLKMWPQEEDKSAGVLLTANDEGGYVQTQTPDRSHSTSLSAHGLAELSVQEGRS